MQGIIASTIKRVLFSWEVYAEGPYFFILRVISVNNCFEALFQGLCQFVHVK